MGTCATQVLTCTPGTVEQSVPKVDYCRQDFSMGYANCMHAVSGVARFRQYSNYHENHKINIWLF